MEELQADDGKVGMESATTAKWEQWGGGRLTLWMPGEYLRKLSPRELARGAVDADIQCTALACM